MVPQSYMLWKTLNKAIEKDDVILNMDMEIGPPSQAWRALIKRIAETNEAAN